MAVTQGHGNPDWTRDEIVLALDLYFRMGGARHQASDTRVDELSLLLQSLPYHRDQKRNPRFRNRAGVSFKLQNFNALATGRGLKNGSVTDRNVWEEFQNRPSEVAALAAIIRAGLSLTETERLSVEDDEDTFVEGRIATRTHKARERNPKLRQKLLRKRGVENLCCEICGQTHAHLGNELRDSVFEAHHLIPVSTAGERKTSIQDMALLCANCHRLLHRAISRERRWVDLAEVRQMLAARGGTGG